MHDSNGPDGFGGVILGIVLIVLAMFVGWMCSKNKHPSPPKPVTTQSTTQEL